jgi:hypothetical protein
MSRLVANMLESLLYLWRLTTSPEHVSLLIVDFVVQQTCILGRDSVTYFGIVELFNHTSLMHSFSNGVLCVLVCNGRSVTGYAQGNQDVVTS